AARTVGDFDAPARPAHDLVSDGHSEPGARNILAARPVGAEEGLEHLVNEILRDAGAIVLDDDARHGTAAAHADPRSNAVGRRVDDQVAQRAVQLEAARPYRNRAQVHAGHVEALLLEVGADVADQLIEPDAFRRRGAGLFAHEHDGAVAD